MTSSSQNLDALIGKRKGPFLSHNPVSRTQIWQWCSAMGDGNPLYLDATYHRDNNIAKAIAPPAMMQMWTMRDVNMRYAAGSTDEKPYEVMDVLSELGYAANVAVSYDLHFHRLLEEGDVAYHYNSIHSISELKTTGLGEGHFFVEHAEFFDQQDRLFAEAFITYFQYQPGAGPSTASDDSAADSGKTIAHRNDPQTSFSDIRLADIAVGDALPELVLPISHKLIVAGAIASQDFIDVHHNLPEAQAAAMPDIFMNILTTCGLCGRYLTDWAGPASRIKRLTLKLLAPNTPGDTMTLQGRVAALDAEANTPSVDVEFGGKNGLGYHVTGSAKLQISN